MTEKISQTELQAWRMYENHRNRGDAGASARPWGELPPSETSLWMERARDDRYRRIFVSYEDFECLEERVKSLESRVPDYDEPDSDGWIPHDGGECPVSNEMRVDLRFGNGRELKNISASIPHWPNYNYAPHRDITHYRPAKQEEEWPQVGDRVWFIDYTGEARPGLWSAREPGTSGRDFLGVYRTKEAAEEAAAKIRRIMEHLRNGEHVILATDTRMVTAEKVEL